MRAELHTCPKLIFLVSRATGFAIFRDGEIAAIHPKGYPSQTGLDLTIYRNTCLKKITALTRQEPSGPEAFGPIPVCLKGDVKLTFFGFRNGK